MFTEENILVYPENSNSRSRAEKIALRLGCGMTESISVSDDVIYLAVSFSGLALLSGDMRLDVDYANISKRILNNMWKHELLARAVKIKNNECGLKALDATAGFGEDSFIIAAAGYTVDMFERNPVICELLSDAVKRASDDKNLYNITEKLNIIRGDSVAYMHNTAKKYDVVYLDPMFPEKHNRSLAKKKFQILHRIEPPCTDEKLLFESALTIRPKRIVVKRADNGPYMAGYKPDYSLEGKAVRYDIYTVF